MSRNSTATRAAGPGKKAASTLPTGTTPAKNTVSITVLPGAIQCKPKGGSVRARNLPATAPIRWESDTPFKLEFYTLEFDDNNNGKRVWPFVDKEPVWPVLSFQGTPKGGQSPLYYKYTISAGGMFLDPIVIVDK